MSAVIVSAYAVLEQAKRLHSTPEDWSEGDLRDRILAHPRYRRDRVALATLDLGHYAIDEIAVADFIRRRRAGDAFPPIVCEADGGIIDGEHRAQAALIAGDTMIDAYIALD
jgi:hypothetical protein